MKKYHALLLALCLLPVFALAAPLMAEGYEYQIDDNQSITILGYQGDETNLILPDTLAGLPVTALGEEAFAYQQLNTITLPKGLETMGINPFLGCTAEVLTGENQRFAVVDGALLDTQTHTLVAYLATGEKDVQVLEGVRAIAPRAFYGNQTLESITLPAGLQEIGPEAFTECVALEGIVLPQELTAIANQSFMGCVGLKDITLPSTVNTVGDWAFAKSGLESITLPEGLHTVGDWAFLRCHNMVAVTLPASLKNISDSAFDSIAPEALFTVEAGSAGEAWVQNSEYNYQVAGL